MDDLKKMKYDSEKALDNLSDKMSDLIFAGEELTETCSEQEAQISLLNSELEEQEETFSRMEKELYFLGKFLSENKVDFPLEGHAIDFGAYLPFEDDRRYNIVVEW